MALIDSHGDGNQTVYVSTSGGDYLEFGQSFLTPSSVAYKVTSASFFTKRATSGSGYVVAQLWSYTSDTFPGGWPSTLLAVSDTISVNSISTSFSNVSFTFSGANQYVMSPDTAYVITHRVYGDGRLGTFVDDTVLTHSGRSVFYYAGAWGWTSTNDTTFEIYGDVAGGIFPSGIGSTAAVGSPTLAFGDITISPTGIASTAAVGEPTIETYIVDAGGIAATSAVGAPTITQTDPPPPPPTDWDAIGREDKKVYTYKVYDSDNAFIGIWRDEVLDELEFSQSINTPGTTTTIRLGRSPSKRTETRSNLTTEAGVTITTEDDQPITVVTTTPNSVGEGTDIELNHNVDIYVHYGGFQVLTTEDGEIVTTEDEQEIVVGTGAPLGERVFSGFIMDYESSYGEESGVTVTLASHGHELSQELIKSGSNTTVSYSSQAIETTVKAILDTNPGTVTYTAGSIAATATNVAAKFQLNTKLEGIKTLVDQTPDGWYWYGNVADNLLYLQERSVTPDHTFVLGKHIKNVKVKRSIENLVNEVHFVGGEVTPGDPATILYKKYEDATSQTDWRKGLHRKTDRRFTVAGSMQKYADKQMARFSEPIFTTPLVISSARYDVESIHLGQTVGFRNFGNFIDEVVLQIVNFSYTPYAVTLELGELLESQADIITDVESELNNEQYVTIPTAPA